MQHACTWSLRCVGGATTGAGPQDVAFASGCEFRPDGGVLQVGRVIQPASLWERLVPDATLRNTISREHFEVRSWLVPGEDGDLPMYLLKNLSGRGTWLNGSVVKGEAYMRPGDIVGVGEATGAVVSVPSPALCLRLVAPDSANAAVEARAPESAIGLEGGCDENNKAHMAFVFLSAARLSGASDSGRGEVRASAYEGPLEIPLPTSSGDSLRIGRGVQPRALWESMLPDESFRNCVSREHYVVRADDGTGTNCSMTLTSLSALGVLHNGELIRQGQQCRLAQGDIVAIPRPQELGLGEPLLQLLVGLQSTGAHSEKLTLDLSDCVLGSASAPSRLELERTPPARACTGPQRVVEPLAPTPRLAANSPQGGQASVRTAESDRVDFVDVTNHDNAPNGDVVRVSLWDLPAPFSLHCVYAHGLMPGELEALPQELRVLEASCSLAELRVGRAIQSAVAWEALVPTATLRNTISREHFEIALGDDGLLRLTNLSAGGTLVNSKRIRQHVRVEDGDEIGIGDVSRSSKSTVVFRLVRNGAEEMERNCGECRSQDLPPTVLNADVAKAAGLTW